MWVWPETIGRGLHLSEYSLIRHGFPIVEATAVRIIEGLLYTLFGTILAICTTLPAPLYLTLVKKLLLLLTGLFSL